MKRVMVELTINGRKMRAPKGSSAAVAILNARPLDHPGWTPLCGMGVCWGCRATIDGVADRRTCLVAIAPGMEIRIDHGHS